MANMSRALKDAVGMLAGKGKGAYQAATTAVKPTVDAAMASPVVTQTMAALKNPGIAAGAGALGGAALAAPVAAGAGYGGAMDEQQAQMSEQQQMQMQDALAEMGKSAVLDPSTGASYITPQAIDKALAKVMGTANLPQLSPEEYMQVAQMGGMQLQLQGGQ